MIPREPVISLSKARLADDARDSATTPPPATTRAAADGSIDGSFDAGGHKLHLRCEGTGSPGSPTIVYLHGLGGDGSDVKSINTRLTSQARVCTYDRLNVGRSDRAEGRHSGADSVVDFYRTTDQAKPLVAKVPDVPVTSTWSSPSSSSRRSTGSSRWPSPILHSMTPTGFPATLPAPRRPDPLAVPALRWGVLGTGWIAERFVHALRTSTTQQVVAVGSRTQASADRFADAAGVLTAHGSPEALVADPGVEVVYVATPHQAHRASALLAIAAGKHVLVEKPMGLDAAQAEEVSAAAATAGVLCMEAMWTLFLPRFDVVRQVLEQGLLGDVRTVLADHGERFDPPHRILDPAMAGGSLLDLGCYLTALATWTLGPAQDVYATGEMTPSGVNGQAAMVLTHGGGARSVLHTTLLTRTPTAAVIAGTAATLTLPGPFFMPGDVVLTSADGNRTVTRAEPEPIGHGGLYHSAVEVALRVSAGELESPLRPATDVVAGLRALDEVGRQLGVRYDAAR